MPVNPLKLRDRKYGEAKVSAAGPASNLIIALIFGFGLRFLPLGATEFTMGLATIFAFIVWINVLLMVFNLIPIPPLDGSHILFAVIPEQYNRLKMILHQYGFIVLLAFLFFLFPVLIPIVKFFFTLITGHNFI